MQAAHGEGGLVEQVLGPPCASVPSASSPMLRWPRGRLPLRRFAREVPTIFRVQFGEDASLVNTEGANYARKRCAHRWPEASAGTRIRRHKRTRGMARGAAQERRVASRSPARSPTSATRRPWPAASRSPLRPPSGPDSYSGGQRRAYIVFRIDTEGASFIGSSGKYLRTAQTFCHARGSKAAAR
jgi:hypothetical protein